MTAPGSIAPDTASRSTPIRLIAIIAAYNEEDIIGPAISHLIEQGASVYLLDDGSTDRTVAVAQRFAGRGLIGIEALSHGVTNGASGIFSLSRILDRKAQLAQTIDAEWFINHDADEFRESPWPHLTLVQAVALVDRLGWNAIDFEVFNFVPENEKYQPGENPRTVFRRCRPAPEYDRAQVRCWKKTAGPVELASTAGHDTQFPGRRVCPIRFPMRHYPIRSAEQGERKVFRDRKPRFDPAERARGWHVQYDRFIEGGTLFPDPAPAPLYDPEVSRLAVQIRNRLVEAACPSIAPGSPFELADTVRQIEDDLVRQSEHVRGLTEALEQRRREIDALCVGRDEAVSRLREAADHAKELMESLGRERDENEVLRATRDEAECRQREAAAGANALSADNEAMQEELGRVRRNLADISARLEDTYASKSWRITAPLRAVWRILGGK